MRSPSNQREAGDTAGEPPKGGKAVGSRQAVGSASSVAVPPSSRFASPSPGRRRLSSGTRAMPPNDAGGLPTRIPSRASAVSSSMRRPQQSSAADTQPPMKPGLRSASGTVAGGSGGMKITGGIRTAVNSSASSSKRGISASPSRGNRRNPLSIANVPAVSVTIADETGKDDDRNESLSTLPHCSSCVCRQLLASRRSVQMMRADQDRLGDVQKSNRRAMSIGSPLRQLWNDSGEGGGDISSEKTNFLTVASASRNKGFNDLQLSSTTTPTSTSAISASFAAAVTGESLTATIPPAAKSARDRRAGNGSRLPSAADLPPLSPLTSSADPSTPPPGRISSAASGSYWAAASPKTSSGGAVQRPLLPTTPTSARDDRPPNASTVTDVVSAAVAAIEGHGFSADEVLGQCGVVSRTGSTSAAAGGGSSKHAGGIDDAADFALDLKEDADEDDAYSISASLELLPTRAMSQSGSVGKLSDADSNICQDTAATPTRLNPTNEVQSSKSTKSDTPLGDENSPATTTASHSSSLAAVSSPAKASTPLSTTDESPAVITGAAVVGSSTSSTSTGVITRRSGGTVVPSDQHFSRKGFILSHKGPLDDHYELETKQLGQGTYGSVSRAVHKATKIVRAMKKIQKSKVTNADRFRQEISIMKYLDHPNIIKLYETFEDETNIYLALELCSGGELFDRIIDAGFFTEEVGARIMRQIFAAIYYLHYNTRVVHRDIKPENFLFLDKTDSSPLKIIDFGLATPCDDAKVLTTKAGTPYYVAPQVLSGHYSNKCDVWSAGVIMYILLCGYPPFHGDTDAEILQRVKSGKLVFNDADWKGVTPQAKELISGLLRYDEKERLSSEQALKHSWLAMWQSSKTPTLGRQLTASILDNFKVFRRQSKLKKAAITYVARQLDDERIQKLKSIFLALDTDGDGALSIDEMKEGLLSSELDLQIEIEALISEVDSDGSGLIDYTEFLAAALDRSHYVHEDTCWQAFRLFDLDGDGKISRNELLEVLHSNHNESEQLAEAEIDRLISEVDKDGDGQVDFAEFWEMMKAEEAKKR